MASDKQPTSPLRTTLPTAPASNTSADIPRPKRIACVVCRKRKLRCDGNKPSCGTCSRLGHECAYDEVRRKSGPKRGYVKALEARLAQVESLLKNQDTPQTDSHLFVADRVDEPSTFQNSGSELGTGYQVDVDIRAFEDSTIESTEPEIENALPIWDMVSLGVEEALPTPKVQDALHHIFFDMIYPTIPVLHKGRYLSSLNLAPSMRPPIALRYAMWTLAASVSDKYFNLAPRFYQMARKYAEEQELRGHGETLLTLSAPQTWVMIATYEFKNMYFPRAWLSTGRAVRLAQMMGLYRIDGHGLDVKQCLQPPKDWTEKEERRRTFWLAFCVDRYASIGTGWPMSIEEKDIMTNLPSSEDAFELGRPSQSLTLKDAMTADGAQHLSPLGGVVLMACLYGRNLIHVHRPQADDRDNEINGEWWRRHRHMDNILLNIAMSLPSHFRLPMGLNDPNIIFTNMNIHTAAICLHQAAIYKATTNKMDSSIVTESRLRCITAAAAIANIMRIIAHTDLCRMGPFISFSLYVAARVFVFHLKIRPKDEQFREPLQFLVTALGHIKQKNPLSESFLFQLDLDVAGLIPEGPVMYSSAACSGYPPKQDPIKQQPISDPPAFSTNTRNESPQSPLDRFHLAFKQMPGMAHYPGKGILQGFIPPADSPSDGSSCSNLDISDSNTMTPLSSHTTDTSPHTTPLNPVVMDSFPPQMDSPLPGMFQPFGVHTGYTPLPQDNPLSPPKDPWAQGLTGDQVLDGMYSEVFSQTYSRYSGNDY